VYSWHSGDSLCWISFAAKQINCKLVYYGAGLGGKTTNLEKLCEMASRKAPARGKSIPLATETGGAPSLDFLPLDFGTVRGFKTRFHLYAVPGQVFHDATRKRILRGADGVVFVADSQAERMDANLESMENLQENLREHGCDLMTLPYVLQLNKRDLPNVLSVEQLARKLRRKDEPVIEAVACKGIGIFETLNEVSRLVLAELGKE